MYLRLQVLEHHHGMCFNYVGAFYQRIGDIVKGNITFWCNPTSSSTDPFEITITPPILPTVTFGTSGENRLVGNCMITENAGAGSVNVGLFGYTGDLIKIQTGTSIACNAGSNYRVVCDFSYSLI